MEVMLQILFWATVPLVIVWLAIGYIFTVAFVRETASYTGEDDNEWIN